MAELCDRDGFNINGYDKFGFDRTGYNEYGYDNSEDMFMKLKVFENKEFILKALNMIKQNSKVFDDVIEYLTNRDYCKDIFELQFELLREIKPGLSSDDIRRLYYDNANCLHLRYYNKNIFVYKSKKYIVCNHWYGIQRDKFIKWLILKFAQELL